MTAVEAWEEQLEDCDSYIKARVSVLDPSQETGVFLSSAFNVQNMLSVANVRMRGKRAASELNPFLHYVSHIFLKASFRILVSLESLHRTIVYSALCQSCNVGTPESAVMNVEMFEDEHNFCRSFVVSVEV